MTVPGISPIEKPWPLLLWVLALLVEEEKNVVLVLVRVWSAWVTRLQD
jgi:hypothetical protein